MKYDGLLAGNWYITRLYGRCWLATATKTKRTELITTEFAKKMAARAETVIDLDTKTVIKHSKETDGFIDSLDITEARIYVLIPPNAKNLKDIHLLAMPATNRKYNAKPEVFEHFFGQVESFLDGRDAQCCYFAESLVDDYYIEIAQPTDSTFGEYKISNNIYSYSQETFAAALLGFANLYGLEIPSESSPKWNSFKQPKGGR